MNKVCFITGAFPLETQTFVVNQVVSAINNNFEVKVLAYDKKSENSSAQKDLLKQYNILNLTGQIDFKIPKNVVTRFIKGLALSLKHFKYLTKAGLGLNPRLLFTVPFKINYFLELKKTDVFHVHFGHFGMDLALMKKMGVLASKIITTFHGYDANMKSEKEKQVLIKQYKNLFVQSDTITVNTNYLKDILLQLNCENDKLKIIPMGINMDLFKCDKIKKISTNKPVNLISIGRIIELKGHKYAIQSVKKLIDKGYTIHYTIIGTGRLKNELKNLINKLDVSEHVVLVGKKSQSEIKEYFEASHLFLMSSVTDSDNRREAQGLVTIEAQASGLPVIGFDSGGVKYTFINNKTGILVNEKDTDAYANAIAQLINDVDLYQSCSLAAPEFVNANFNLDITSKKFISLYNN